MVKMNENNGFNSNNNQKIIKNIWKCMQDN